LIIFISGGVKSGKSGRALKLAREWKRPVSFIATAEVLDDEMKERIERHKAEREGLGFTTLEEPLELAAALALSGGYVLVDCLTMWVNNIMYHGREADFTKMLDAFIEGLTGKDACIVVSNETGFGNIPADELTRRYNLILAEANRKIAAAANHVELMVAGLPLTVK
jgi:adenosylcobinamide kinase/adenosylcobinamide-phosphate guanylyltransferase